MISKQIVLIFFMSFILNIMAVPLANKILSDSEIVPEVSITDDQSYDLYKFLCSNLVHSEEWFSLRHSVQKICLELIATEYSNKSSNKQRRFFALQVGKSLPHQNTDSTNKGFKYGRK